MAKGMHKNKQGVKNNSIKQTQSRINVKQPENVCRNAADGVGDSRDQTVLELLMYFVSEVIKFQV